MCHTHVFCKRVWCINLNYASSSVNHHQSKEPPVPAFWPQKGTANWFKRISSSPERLHQTLTVCSAVLNLFTIPSFQTDWLLSDVPGYLALFFSLILQYDCTLRNILLNSNNFLYENCVFVLEAFLFKHESREFLRICLFKRKYHKNS